MDLEEYKNQGIAARKKVKLVKFGKGLIFTTQFLPRIPHGASLGV